MMKCKKCGTELGQKNLCPVCGKTGPTAPEPPATQPAPESSAPATVDFSNEELDRIDEFVKNSPENWNDEFDEFYEKQVFAAGYKETVAKCRRRAEIFAAVRKKLEGVQKLSGDLMISIMEELPKKYPEIDEYQVRALAREFFARRNAIRRLTLRDFAGLSAILSRLMEPSSIPMDLKWCCKENDIVDADAKLCSCVLGVPLGMPLLTVLALPHHISAFALRSPCRGKIISIRREPFRTADDVLCEIEPFCDDEDPQ